MVVLNKLASSKGKFAIFVGGKSIGKTFALNQLKDDANRIIIYLSLRKYPDILLSFIKALESKFGQDAKQLFSLQFLNLHKAKNLMFILFNFLISIIYLHRKKV